MTRGAASARSAGIAMPLQCQLGAFRSWNVGRNRGDPRMALAAQRAQTGGTDARARLLEIIRQRSLLRGTFKLVSGATSDYYLDMKPTTFHPGRRDFDRRDHLRHDAG